MSTFDSLLAEVKTQKAKGCPNCGSPNTVIINVRMQRLEKGRPTGSAVTKSRNFCEPCATALFVKFRDEVAA